VILLLAGAALAGDPAVTAEVHGNAKTFFLATFPYENELLMPPGPYGQGAASGRIAFTAKALDHLTLEVHPAFTLQSAVDNALGDTVGTGVGLSAPEAVDLTWTNDDDGTLAMMGRIDWLSLRTSYPGIDVTLGRQPIGFGNGLFFTPMDLVNPFAITTIDTEYRPGVDAVRVDGFLGMSGKITGVAAYAGDWDLEGTVLAATGQGTIGVTDLSGFVGSVHAEPVFGIGMVTSLGPVGIHSDSTLTLAADDDPFVRSVLGATWIQGNTTLSGEVYVQTFGASEPDAYLVVATSDRYARGEVWQLGRYYAAVSLAHQITPLLNGGVAVITNLQDPSGMLAPNLSWSVAENADLSLGAYAGLGKRPDEVDPLDLINPETFQPYGPKQIAGRLGIQSEFGLIPVTTFLQMRAYF
jgi:hypothetical protein